MPSPETLRSLASDEFLIGLVYGFAALALGALIVYVWREWRDDAAPILGVVLTAATLLAFQAIRQPSGELWFGIALLALGGSLFSWARRVPLLPAVLAVPGAWWVTQIVELPGAEWILWVLFGWIVAGAPLVASFDRHFADRGYGPVFLVVSIAGMFSTLPDTEEILVVLGAAVLLPLLAWPKVFASLGSIGIYPVFGVLAWVIAFGGRGRESAVVGAVACLGLLSAEPLARWWRKKTLLDLIPNKWWWVLVAAGVQVAVVLLAARGVGLSEDAQPAVFWAVLLQFGVIATLAFATSARPNRFRDRIAAGRTTR